MFPQGFLGTRADNLGALWPGRGHSDYGVGLAAALVELDADAFAVQEIRDIEPFERVVADAGARLGRDYAATLMPYCDAYQGRPIYLGVVVDRARLERFQLT